ncbi:hypothetical protein D3C83_44130 [compost metagenome]
MESERRTGLGASALVAPMVPIEIRPETAKIKNRALQFRDSVKAMRAMNRPTSNSGAPRQPPA